MTAVLPATSQKRSRFPSYQSRCPAAQRYFLDDTSIVLHKASNEQQYPVHSWPSSTTSSAPSSIPPSPRTDQSLPTPTLSSLSLDLNAQLDEEELLLPPYDANSCAPKESETASDTSTASLADTRHLNPHTPAADDITIEEEPSRHVDYLSHEWDEEDIWASWRYVVARRNVYDNGVRLENASWRTWAKVKLQRGTVSPETLNWLKDCDVTWLYGPLKTCRRRASVLNVSPPPSRLATPTLYADPKPILKKRTASETILQRSLSQHTLLKHAGAILKAQEAESNRSRPPFPRTPSELGQMLHHHPKEGSEGSSSNVTPTNLSSSGVSSPSEKRHIHFNNEVVQCIAVEAKGDYEDVCMATFDEELSSDDGIVMMKQRSPQTSPSGGSTPRGSFSGDNKTIAPLPSTTLKYRGDTPEPSTTSLMPRLSGYFSRSSSTPASSLHTSDPAADFFLGDEDNDLDFNWEPGSRSEEHTDSSPWFVNPEDDQELKRQSSSGMFMAYDDGEPSNLGIIERVVDTVNTARDIAHVIWNVGWRR
ncbi:hypothetical protein FE257_007205 [Aspergillus nanangensis]|uniref:Nitrogen regulatory protein areA GATA-like domain-containing protein n=1 Tax=Aspergillus nanangensis TaxID=2582783 RepID=A0AAD4GUB9_ASPNN|nr:hypothetical protein FE257_007205 [Aspergillus nanangensis]